MIVLDCFLVEGHIEFVLKAAKRFHFLVDAADVWTAASDAAPVQGEVEGHHIFPVLLVMDSGFSRLDKQAALVAAGVDLVATDGEPVIVTVYILHRAVVDEVAVEAVVAMALVV